MRKSLLVAALLGCAALPVQASVVTVTPYLSENDIPANFYAGGAPTFLQNFENGTFPGGNLGGGITANRGSVIGPGGLADSVDGDDGSIDGSGTAGRSWFYSIGPTGITFTFDSTVTAAGLVWTDGAGDTTFSAFDALGDLLATTTVTIAGSGTSGQTAEDTFFGFMSAGGIKSIFIRNSVGGIEVDHVQYGNMFVAPVTPPDAQIPLPAAGWMMIAGLGALAALRRRRKA